jgi:hypothetical protein
LTQPTAKKVNMTMPTQKPAGAPIPLPIPTAIGTLPSCPVRGDMGARCIPVR